MDRKTWLAVGLSIAALVLWQWYYNATYGPYLKQQEEQRLKAAAAQAAPSATPGGMAGAPAPEAVASPTPAIAPQAVMTARKESLISSDKKARTDFIFNNDTGGI